jgi:hypothetical protein
MGPKHSVSANGGAGPLPPLAPAPGASGDLRRLGQALQSQVDEVLATTAERTTGPGHEIDPIVQASFERISRTTTGAVGRWIAGEGMTSRSRPGGKPGRSSASWPSTGRRC